MDELNTKRLLVLRKLTRAVADLLRGQLKDYLTTLAPVLRPRSILGEHVESDVKEFVKGAEAAFKDLQVLYARVAAARPFNLAAELKSPLEVVSAVPEITPVEYAHAARTPGQSKTIMIASPLKWVLSYGSFGPRQLRELLAERTGWPEPLLAGTTTSLPTPTNPPANPQSLRQKKSSSRQTKRTKSPEPVMAGTTISLRKKLASRE